MKWWFKKKEKMSPEFYALAKEHHEEGCSKMREGKFLLEFIVKDRRTKKPYAIQVCRFCGRMWMRKANGESFIANSESVL